MDVRCRQKFVFRPLCVRSITLSNDVSLEMKLTLTLSNTGTGKFAYGFKIGLMLKDVRIALNVVKGLSDEYFAATERFLTDAVKRFGYDADFTEVVRVLENDIGLTLRDDAAKASL